MTVQAHATAVLALLAAASGSPALVVYDGVTPVGAVPPYALVYFADERPEGPEKKRLTGASDRFVLRIICHCVGGNAVAARAVSTRVAGALLDVIPVVSGRVCWPIRQEEGLPPARDESTGTLVMSKVDTYRLESKPA